MEASCVLLDYHETRAGFKKEGREKKENFKEVGGGESFHFKRVPCCTKHKQEGALPAVGASPILCTHHVLFFLHFFFSLITSQNYADVPKNTPFEERNQGRFASHDNEATLSSPNGKKNKKNVIRSSLGAMENVCLRTGPAVYTMHMLCHLIIGARVFQCDVCQERRQVFCCNKRARGSKATALPG